MREAKRMTAAALVALAVMLSGAAPRPIQAPPMNKGDCHWVHGRFAVYNGRRVRRIWIVGTRRMVALADDDAAIPPVVQAYERRATADPSIVGLLADFRLCAREDSRPGHLQLVRMADVRNPRLAGEPFPVANPTEP